MKTILVLSLAALMTACGSNQGDDRLKEVSKLQSEADLEVQAKRAEELEQDLAQRQRYYKALAGEFSGTIKTNGSEFSVRMNFVPKVPAYKPTRTRTIEEVTNDLLSLGFDIQVVQWVKGNEATAIGCVFEDTKPNFEEGAIYAITDQCSSFFTLFPAAEELAAAGSNPSEGGKATTLGVLNGQVPLVNKLVGLSKPSANPSIFKFELKRVK